VSVARLRNPICFSPPPRPAPAGPWKNTRHNDAATFYQLYILPSSFWLVIPTLIAVNIGSRIAKVLAGDIGGSGSAAAAARPRRAGAAKRD
jgi:hypothetical protein